ncbi:hypothetical protein [Acaryochloris sp. CCMEE 5410]|uniref:hypothetical protein n=1 Tax=Acaryochloris sp. CCMEE 5410 TaxID=310037 RepID=UPI0002484705|nr:hypothetical protein [Acaryochloris sp. CCMEE 5410]KAI9129965.1 hypothetical protein ON05_030360 [Acaryochloris sp. CCMEE 5410]
MENTITVEISQTHVAALLLIAQRLTFEDCLRRTDGVRDIEQAYDFINAIGSLRDALENAQRVH